MTPEEETRWERRLLAGRLDLCEGADDTCKSHIWVRLPRWEPYSPKSRGLCQYHARVEEGYGA